MRLGDLAGWWTEKMNINLWRPSGRLRAGRARVRALFRPEFRLVSGDYNLLATIRATANKQTNSAIANEPPNRIQITLHFHNTTTATHNLTIAASVVILVGRRRRRRRGFRDCHCGAIFNFPQAEPAVGYRTMTFPPVFC